MFTDTVITPPSDLRKNTRRLYTTSILKPALVLIRNTAIEKALNRKMRPHYLGPLVVVLCNKGSAYIVCELDGTLYHNPVAAYRIMPYFVRDYIELLDFEKYSDISVK